VAKSYAGWAVRQGKDRRLLRHHRDAALGIHAASVNTSNREDWEETFERIEDGDVDLLLLIDYTVDSKSTLTEVGRQLRRSAAVAVVPFALINAAVGGEGDRRSCGGST